MVGAIAIVGMVREGGTFPAPQGRRSKKLFNPHAFRAYLKHQIPLRTPPKTTNLYIIQVLTLFRRLKIGARGGTSNAVSFFAIPD